VNVNGGDVVVSFRGQPTVVLKSEYFHR